MTNKQTKLDRKIEEIVDDTRIKTRKHAIKSFYSFASWLAQELRGEDIADQAILRMQIVAEELAGRQKDVEAVNLINDIRGKYEELKDKRRKELGV
jgi:hypothetical protein|tara:strand:+ start:876 stop:1163 length:288 start_codon:yes stop_codon:yes gene_type:complete